MASASMEIPIAVEESNFAEEQVADEIALDEGGPQPCATLVTAMPVAALSTMLPVMPHPRSARRGWRLSLSAGSGNSRAEAARPWWRQAARRPCPCPFRRRQARGSSRRMSARVLDADQPAAVAAAQNRFARHAGEMRARSELEAACRIDAWRKIEEARRALPRRRRPAAAWPSDRSRRLGRHSRKCWGCPIGARQARAGRKSDAEPEAGKDHVSAGSVMILMSGVLGAATRSGGALAGEALGSVAILREGQEVAQDQPGATQQLSLAQGGRLRGGQAGCARNRRRRRPVLPARPVEREIIEIVAEIGSRPSAKRPPAGLAPANAWRAWRCGNCRVEASSRRDSRIAALVEVVAPRASSRKSIRLCAERSMRKPLAVLLKPRCRMRRGRCC